MTKRKCLGVHCTPSIELRSDWLNYFMIQGRLPPSAKSHDKGGNRCLGLTSGQVSVVSPVGRATRCWLVIIFSFSDSAFISRLKPSGHMVSIWDLEQEFILKLRFTT